MNHNARTLVLIAFTTLVVHPAFAETEKSPPWSDRQWKGGALVFGEGFPMEKRHYKHFPPQLSNLILGRTQPEPWVRWKRNLDEHIQYELDKEFTSKEVLVCEVRFVVDRYGELSHVTVSKPSSSDDFDAAVVKVLNLFQHDQIFRFPDKTSVFIARASTFVSIPKNASECVKRYMRGRVQHANGELDAALASYQRALDLRDEHAPEKIDAEILMSMASAYVLQNDAELAQDSYQKAICKNPALDKDHKIKKAILLLQKKTNK